MILLGPPASGKGTQGRYITRRHHLPVTSVGDVLRREKSADTLLGREAASYFDHGTLVPDRLAIACVSAWLHKHSSQFVFDGFPRTVGQAEALAAILREQSAPLCAAIWLEVDVDTIRDRVAKRLVCEQCGHTFRLGWQVQSRADVCPECGGSLQTRHDDNAETLLHRIAQYDAHTAPLIPYYEATGLLRRIDASQSAEEVSGQIEAVFAEADLEQTATFKHDPNAPAR